MRVGESFGLGRLTGVAWVFCLVYWGVLFLTEIVYRLRISINHVAMVVLICAQIWTLVGHINKSEITNKEVLVTSYQI